MISNSSDLYIFFTAISQTEPRSILDVGPFMKQAGIISRQFCDQEIPVDTVLDAVDYTDMNFPVFDTVYNHIFKSLPEDGRYDLAVSLYNENLGDDLWEYYRGHVRYVLTDMNNEDRLRRISEYARIKVLGVEDAKSKYALVVF